MCYILSYDWVSAHLIPSLTDLRGMSLVLLSSAAFWFVAALILIVCLLRDFVWKLYAIPDNLDHHHILMTCAPPCSYKRQFRPREYHIVQEIQSQDKHSAPRGTSQLPKVSESASSSV